MLDTPDLHLNPKTFKDPLVFNPWHWKVCDARVLILRLDLCFGSIALWFNLLSEIYFLIRRSWFNYSMFRLTNEM